MALEIKQDVLLAQLTTFKTGGRAKYFCEVKNVEELKEAMQWLKNNPLTGGLPFFILAGGSNLLVSDNGYNGLVIKLFFDKCEVEGEIVKASSDIVLKRLMTICRDNNLSGLEWASGIPRITLGGSVYGNAGAFGKWTEDIVREVKVFDVEKSQVITLSNADCDFSYKESIFKRNKNLIILSAVLQMERTEKEEIIKEEKRVLDYRIKNHPMNYPSAGSIFKNIQVDKKEIDRILFDCQEDFCVGFRERGEIPAAWIIEQCGLKGKKIGGAMISEKHANFIVNEDKATSSDIKALIDLVKRTAQEKMQVQMQEEAQYLGF